MGEFISQSLASRQAQSKTIQQRYPGHVPLILLPYNDNQPKLLRSKFVAATLLTVGQFSSHLWEHLPAEELTSPAQFLLYTDSSNPVTYLLTKICSSLTAIEEQVVIGQLYQEQKDEDGVLYLFYSKVT